MSWQAYVNEDLIASGKIAHATIVDASGAVKALSPGFHLAPGEGFQLAVAFMEGKTNTALRIAGQVYIPTFQSSRFIYGRKDGGGCVLAKVGNTYIIALYNAGTLPSDAEHTVARLADRLQEIS